jgi:small subunit ribosomal protein S1
VLEYQFRVTKYDPGLRDRTGAFTGHDWTSVTEVGESFNGRVLTQQRYDQVENAYLQAVELFAHASGVDQLVVRDPSLPPGIDLRVASSAATYAALELFPLSLHDVYDGLQVPLTVGVKLVRAMLRETGVWCRLEADGRFFAHVGWDYYLYIGSNQPCEQAADQVRRLGLFVEHQTSPYDPELQEPQTYPPADDAFWARVELLAAKAHSELPLLEMWAGNAWRWHLVVPGARLEQLRQALKPRALLTIYPEPPLPITDTTGVQIAERARQLLNSDSAVAGVNGLIEEADTGRLRFDYLLDEEDLSLWLPASRSASRCGIYPASAHDQPGALEGVLPDADGIIRARRQ